MTDKISAAIVGFGRWGQLLHQGSIDCRHLQVTHAVTRSPEKVSDYCTQHNLILSHDIDEVLQNDAVDALIIATPHTQHYGQLMDAAAANKHVYCEKPFTLSGDQASTALSSMRAAGCTVAIGHNRRFAPNTLALRNMIDTGWFGDLVHIDGIFNASMAQAKDRWRDSVEESPAGGMTSLGIHVVDMFINLMGPVDRLSAISERIAPHCNFDDNTTAAMWFKNGARGHLTTLTSTAMRWQITLYGTKGWAELRDLDTLVITPVDGDQEQVHYPGYDYPAIATLTSALDAFASDVKGITPFPISPDEIEHATRILESIIQSSQSGELIRIS
ncbi:MAG: Gfo/Idh/MocA family protein [bacterium]